jgi:hypothetical protein
MNAHHELPSFDPRSLQTSARSIMNVARKMPAAKPDNSTFRQGNSEALSGDL